MLSSLVGFSEEWMVDINNGCCNVPPPLSSLSSVYIDELFPWFLLLLLQRITRPLQAKKTQNPSGMNVKEKYPKEQLENLVSRIARKVMALRHQQVRINEFTPLAPMNQLVVGDGSSCVCTFSCTCSSPSRENKWTSSSVVAMVPLVSFHSCRALMYVLIEARTKVSSARIKIRVWGTTRSRANVADPPANRPGNIIRIVLETTPEGKYRRRRCC